MGYLNGIVKHYNIYNMSVWLYENSF